MRKFPFPRIHGPDHDLCIRSMLSFVFNKHTQLVTSQLVLSHILYIFANNFAAKRDSVLHYTANRLVFSCFSNKTLKSSWIIHKKDTKEITTVAEVSRSDLR